MYFSKELLSDNESEEDENGEDEQKRKTRKMRYPQFNEALGFKDVFFEVGIEFRNLDIFKHVVRDYCVAARVKIKFGKSYAKQCRAKCEDPCQGYFCVHVL
ncbi:hypothetical protein L6164_025301 [Bauhinia variegata]|nr:hypothetical protein L6164_025301 [Bauhinia variegata]